MNIALGIIVIIASVFLVVAVLMQQGKSHNLSGTIAGGAETFFGKSKAQTVNKKLNTLTTIVAVVFVVIVLVFYISQDNTTDSGLKSTGAPVEVSDNASSGSDTEVVSDSSAESESGNQEA